MSVDPEIFKSINNAVLDLQSAHLQTFMHNLKKVSRLLWQGELESISRELAAKADLDAFLKRSEDTQGSMVGSAELAWPDDQEETLGLTLLLIQKCANEERAAENIAFTFYYSGSKILSSLNSMTRQLVLPFARDYKDYVLNREDPRAVLLMPASNKVFIVHGHDEAALQGLARFLEKLSLEVIILREQPDQGQTIIEKFEQSASDVGFAVVLLTPDDVGSAVKGSAQDARARQNVIFELGYLRGKLGRGRICLLRKGDVEIPSDLSGVIYTDMDAGQGWHNKLVRELRAAGLIFDASRLWS